MHVFIYLLVDICVLRMGRCCFTTKKKFIETNSAAINSVPLLHALLFNVYYRLTFRVLLHLMCGPGSSVVIATGYGLDGPGIESRWGGDFSAPGQTGPGAYPASCTMGTGFFPGVKSGWGVTLTPHPLLVPWS